MYKFFLKPLLFLLNPEKAHHVALFLLGMALKVPFSSTLFRKLYGSKEKSLKRTLWGLEFPNPVGLAAGFDKDGRYFGLMEALGFGFIEIGTVTPLPQAGNPQPRLFRLPGDKALINRMGFNNEGVDALAERLKKRKKSSLIIGGNIGKNKMTPNENAKADYLKCMDALFPYVDYFVVNVSSPNTPGLRELQEKEPLTDLLATLMTENKRRAKPKPLLLKIAPDLTNSQLDDIIEITGITGIHGIIATNTTLDRSMLSVDHSAIGPGGLSGAPLTRPSTEVIRYLVHKSGGNIPVIGVGGIMSPQDALEKLAAGASLVQVYTGLVYEGPGLVRRINDEISRQKTATGRN